MAEAFFVLEKKTPQNPPKIPILLLEKWLALASKYGAYRRLHLLALRHAADSFSTRSPSRKYHYSLSHTSASMAKTPRKKDKMSFDQDKSPMCRFFCKVSKEEAQKAADATVFANPVAGRSLQRQHASYWYGRGLQGVTFDGRQHNSFGSHRRGAKSLPPELETEVLDLMARICRAGEEVCAPVLRPAILAYITSADGGKWAGVLEGEDAFGASDRWIRSKLRLMDLRYRKVGSIGDQAARILITPQGSRALRWRQGGTSKIYSYQQPYQKTYSPRLGIKYVRFF